MFGIVASIAALSILIFIHEFGHYIMARKAGVRVEKFSLGFGRKLFGFKKGDTEYTICLVPLGGYVKLAGDNPDEFLGKSDEFLSKRIMSRALIVFMGPFLNYLLAFLIFWIIFIIGYPALSSKVGGILDNYPAKTAGIQEGDIITSINGEKVRTWEDMQKNISGSPGPDVRITLARGSQLIEKEVILKEDVVSDIFGKKRALKFIGVTPSEETVFMRFGAVKSFSLAAQRLYSLTVFTLRAMANMFTGALSVRDSVTGPLGIVYISTKAAGIGLSAFLNVMAILSMSLGIFNLLPLPILDGGHLLMLLIEKIKGSRLSTKVSKIVNDLGMSFIILLAVLVFVNDLIKFQVFDKIFKFFVK